MLALGCSPAPQGLRLFLTAGRRWGRVADFPLFSQTECVALDRLTAYCTRPSSGPINTPTWVSGGRHHVPNCHSVRGAGAARTLRAAGRLQETGRPASGRVPRAVEDYPLNGPSD